ncbi:MAG: prepilin-type N-terminal cleavage/methylation domain-containing protein [Candidatus Aureabacteria bacterium]|nr:prepilin-type N-terminal cleavage/methylation domain-containing protein [Candidatus Auribacterota bacterium]
MSRISFFRRAYKPPAHLKAAGKQFSLNGFTLVEMLVVMFVISLLVSFIAPALSKARNHAQMSVCMSNLHQLYLAFGMYLNDYDETFPINGDPYLWMGRKWREIISPYLLTTVDSAHPDVLFCPGDKVAKEKWEGTSYSYSCAFYHSPSQVNSMSTEDTYNNPSIRCYPQRLPAVRFPENKILLGEWLSNHYPVENDNGWWCWSGYRNFLFVSGRIKYLKAEEIIPAADLLPDPNLTVDGINGRDVP